MQVQETASRQRVLTRSKTGELVPLFWDPFEPLRKAVKYVEIGGGIMGGAVGGYYAGKLIKGPLGGAVGLVSGGLGGGALAYLLVGGNGETPTGIRKINGIRYGVITYDGDGDIERPPGGLVPLAEGSRFWGTVTFTHEGLPRRVIVEVDLEGSPAELDRVPSAVVVDLPEDEEPHAYTFSTKDGYGLLTSTTLGHGRQIGAICRVLDAETLEELSETDIDKACWQILTESRISAIDGTRYGASV